MMSEGFLVGDGSWNLRVFVTDLQVERSLRVKGDLHIGGVMLRLVEDLGESQCTMLVAGESARRLAVLTVPAGGLVLVVDGCGDAGRRMAGCLLLFDVLSHSAAFPLLYPNFNSTTKKQK
ncbi:uncharacterized protein LOC117644021 [Thrips palmi]|uniref:Uncharacterized protein LOC117644021 n=1 Tax=Thrips palmi TaxID=161013 RepID=A0A6P8ZLM2_THRPL|nr:uncharacterized protein LOC117644021 [Thrips palmi]